MIASVWLLTVLPLSAQARTDDFPVYQVQALSEVIEASGDQVDIYYPEISNFRRPGSQDRFPVVVVLQGALVDNEYYSILGQHIAKYGFVVMIPDHESSGLTGLFAENVVITQALEFARILDADRESPLYEITDTDRLGVAGHSFGGAALLYAIAGTCQFPFCRPQDNFVLPAELKAAAAIAASSRGFPVDNTGIPVIVIYGTEDTSVPDNRQQYEELLPPKLQVEVVGTNHFGMNDISEPPGANTDRGEPEPVIPQAITAARFGRWTGLFFQAHIKYDWRAWRKIYFRSADETGVTVTGEPY
jgi:predicted dienelactone hydrolase